MAEASAQETVNVTFTRQVADKQLARPMAQGIPEGYMASCKLALQKAEAAKGGPAYPVDVYYAWGEAQLTPPALSIFHCLVGLQDLWRNEEVMCNDTCELWSLNPELQQTEANPSGKYKLFSDRFVEIYPGYTLSDRMCVRPGPETPRVNLDSLKSILLSTDLARDEELAWIAGGK